ncbi:MAG: DUF2443 family protein [Helicobacteraceae bacterium]
MEDIIEEAIRSLEDSLQELKILLKMSDTNLFSFGSYRQGKTDKPPYLKEWAEESIIGELQNIEKAINSLDEARKEALSYIKKA